MSATKSSAAKKQITKAKSTKMAKLLTSTTLAAAGLMALNTPANADNWGDHVADVGAISIDTSVANTTNISTNDGFVKVRGDGDINAGWTVNVMQPNTTSKYVLYDIEGDPTFVMGTLNANGQVYIFDAQGTIFGEGSVVNVGGLIASTGHISDQNILDNKLIFEGVNTGGQIVLNGTISVAEAGLAAFVAPQVTNNGVISAKLGKVAMASGDKVTLDLYGDNLIEIAVDDKSTDGLIKNSGVIDAEGGVVAMSVQTAKAAVDDVINMSGVVSASSATVVGGKIVLSGGKQGTVKVANGAILDASGKNGGGSVSVTGEVVAVDQETVTNVSAKENGNAGDAYFYGFDKAIFRGNVFANGGALGGNGGFVEVSAGNEVGFDGYVNTLAPMGNAGHFLIDPQYSIIHSGWLNNLLGLNLFLSAEALANSMESNGLVTVQATNTIDVGTDLGWIPGVGGDDIDLSHYDYDTWGVTGTYQYWFFGWRTGYNYGWINHAGTTQANFRLEANTINFNRDLTLGNGNLQVSANTVNLDSKIYGMNGGSAILLDDLRISSNADNVNVLSTDASLQQAVWLADDAGGATIDVAAGTYAESLYINKGLTLKGANDGLAGTDAGRSAETILQGPSTYSLLVDAQNVTVDGLTIEGSASGTGDAVWTFNADNLNFKNNRVLNASFGVISWGGAVVDGVIQDNLIANIAQHGIYIGENQYFNVLNNTVGDEAHGGVRVGITTENFWEGRPDGALTLIDGNKILASVIGIRNNLSYGTQSGFQISNNTINAGGAVNGNWIGIDILSQMGGVGTLFKDNNIEGAGAGVGYQLTNVTNPNRAVIDGGLVKNTDIGVWATDTSLYTGAVSSALIKNVDFAYMNKYGILVESTNYDTGMSAHVTIGEGNTFFGTPYDLAIAGNDATVSLEGTAGVNKTLVKAAGAARYYGFTDNASINVGIGATAAGGTVYVEDGAFTENVVLNKALTLRSLNGRDFTTIAGISGVGALGTIVVTDGVNGATIGGTDAGFTVVGFDNGNPAVENAALYFQGNHAGATVRGNRITANGDEALVTEYNLVNSDFVIDGNIFDGKTYVGAVGATGNQFTVPNVPRQLVALNKGHSNLTFTNNSVVGDAGSNQLVAIESNGSNVTGNTFDGETTSAALRVRGTNAVIADNTLTGNGKGVGIWTQNVNGLTIGGADAEDGNDVSGFINGIVVDGASGTTLVQNNITTNNRDTDSGRSASGWQTGIGIFVKNALGAVTVSDNTTTGNTDGIRIQDTDPAVLGAVTVSGNVANNNRDKGIILKRSDNIKVYDNTVNGNSIGIYADASRGAMIQANDLNGNTADGIRLRDGSNNVRIENNWIHGSANGIYVDNSLVTVSGVKVYDNSFAEADGSQANGKNIVNTTNNIVDASFNWWGTTSEAGVAAKITGLNKVDVSPYQGSGIDQQPATAGYQGNMDNLYVTDAGAQQSGLIQEAINASVVNGTVNVNAGTYTENLLVWKSLKLNGLDGATLRYDVTNAGMGTAGNLITVTASGVNIDPFVFDGLGVATYGTYANGVDGLVIDGNTYRNFAGSAIYLVGNSNYDLKNNVIYNIAGAAIRSDFANGTNAITNNFIGYTDNLGTKGAVGNIGGDGVLLLWGNGGSTTKVEGNDVTRTAGYGLNLIGSNDRLTVTLNDISETGSHGIRLDNTNSAKVIGNDVTNVGGAGIHSTGAQGLLVQLNTVNGTVGAGIHADNTGAGEVWGGPTIDHNTVDNTGSHGIEVVNVATRADLSGSNITNNLVGTLGAANNIKGDGVRADNVGRLAITGNTIDETSGSNDVGSGIFVKNSNGALVGGAGALRNTITNADWDGVKISGGNGVVVENNDVSSINRVGIYAGNATNLTIKNNVVNNTTWSIGAPYGGIAVDWGSNITVSDNTVSNSGHGVMMYLNGGTNTVSGNVLHNVSNNGVNADHVSGLTVSNNYIGYTNKTGAVGGANNIGGAGIVVKNTTNADVINNDIATALNGIVADAANGIDVYNNDIVGRGSSSGTGVKITNSANVNIGDHDETVWVKTGFWPWQGYWKTIDKDNRIGSFDTGVSISGGAQNDVVNNTISNVHYGVKLYGTTYADVLDNSLTGNSVTGIDIVSGSHNANVKGNDISNFTTGINIDGSNDVVIGGWDVALLGTVLFDGNNIEDVKNGIVANNAQRLKIQGNRIVQGEGANGGSGIQLKGSSDDAEIGGEGSWLVTRLKANHITGFNDGIRLDNSDRTKVVQNKVEGAARDGIRLDRGNSNQIKGNNVSDVGSTGIWLNSQTNAVANGNRVNGTGLSGIRVEGSGSNHVDIINNRIDNTGTNGISAVGVADLDVLNNKIGENGGNIGKVGIYVENSSGAQIEENRINNTGANGISVVTSAHARVLDNKVGTLDGNINGDGILVDRSNSAWIKGNRINDTRSTGNAVGSGISVKNSNNVVVGGEGSDRNVITNAQWDGIRVSGGNNITVENNRVTGVDRVGVWMSGTANSNVLDNVIRDTGLSGVRGEDGYNLTIDGNTIDQTGTHGISADGVYGYLTITGNQIGQNYANSIGSDGINVYDGEFVTIGGADEARNNVSGARNGIVADYGYAVDVLNNNVTDVAYDGIRVTSFDYVNVNDNVVTNAGDDGIEVGYADEARILRNVVTTTGDDGIAAYNIGNGYIMPTFALLEEGEGEESGDYYSLIIANNVITDAGQMNAGDDEGDGNEDGNDEGREILFMPLVEGLNGDGIDVRNVASALIDTNTVTNAYDDGIVVEGAESSDREQFMPKLFEGPSSQLVMIRNNDVVDSGNDGIEVRNMAMSTIDINRVLNSGANGFLASGFNNGDVILTGNTLTNNKVGARFESGLIDLTGATNTIIGGEVGLQFDPATQFGIVGYTQVPFTFTLPGAPIFGPEGEFLGFGPEQIITFYMDMPQFGEVSADLNLAGDTIGTTNFSGQSQYYVELLNGALFNPGTPTIIDGINATYDGFSPASQGGILTKSQFDAIEAKIYHYTDLNSLGLFFFGGVPGINDKDAYRPINGFTPGNGPLSLTITGLPIIPGFSGNLGAFLNSITPAAGGNTPPKPQKFSSLVEQLANLEPAAGGGQPGGQQTQQNQQFGESTCWGDAMAAASGGTIVSMSYNNDPSAALEGAASCQTGI